MGKYYKIGYFKNFYKRFKSIDMILLLEEFVLKYICGKYDDDEDNFCFKFLEKEIYNFFKKYNVRGEWFKNKKIMNEIVEVYDF